MNVSRVTSASIVGALLVFSIAVAFKNAAALQPKQQPQRESTSASKRSAEDRPNGASKGTPNVEANNSSERGAGP